MSDPRFYDDEIDVFADDISMASANDVTLTNTYPTLSTPMQSSANSDYGVNVTQILGSAVQTARDIGTAVGTVERTGRVAELEFKDARSNASSGNKIGTFWQYASSTEKAMIALAVVAIFITLNKG